MVAEAEVPGHGPGLRLWLVPSLVVAVVMAALAAMYLGGTVNSSDELHRFPVAVVNADQGATTATGQRVGTGAQITAGLREQVDHDKFDLRVLSLAEARKQLGEAKLYGAIVLPPELSRELGALTAGAVSGGAVERPVVTVYTNQLANSSSASIVNAFATQALAGANRTVGGQLLTRATSAGAGAAKVSGAARLVLSEPMNVRVTPFQPVPGGTGNGVSAFYYALLLVLAGFTGSLIAGNLIDVRLGFLPSEIGPLYRLEDRSGRSRLATLTLKWALMAGVAVIVSTAYLGIADRLGMPLHHPWALWLFGMLAIWAVAVVTLTVTALFGNLGMVVNLFLFIVLSIPSSGGTAPLEATPAVFRFLGTFEPMRQVYLGTRSILYFDAQGDAGLGRALLACAVALVAGLLVGALVTRWYDRKGLDRLHVPRVVGQQV
ncbi:DUF3533 domain-containing protein [Streptomyces sp. NPDC004539]|uniref:YhgE/Pip domain-containing protein n=1 Tax=Streptomyces sp. NPDC004539 TaxID=3154280 RepID=UPI00339ED158